MENLIRGIPARNASRSEAGGACGLVLMLI